MRWDEVGAGLHRLDQPNETFIEMLDSNKEVQDSLTKNLNAAALKEREDIARLNKDAEAQLTKAGIVFNRPDTAPFRTVLKSSGFYTEWKGKYGPEVWGILEKYSGPLA